MSEEQIRRLAARARLEEPPRVDVTDRVMAALTRPESARVEVDNRMLGWTATVCAALAAPAALAIILGWGALFDPLESLLFALPWGAM